MTVPVGAAIVGTQKGGTSTLFDLLRQHPEVCWGPRKEWHVFDDEKRSWTPPDLSDYVVAPGAPGQRLALDGTPSYLFWPRALERLRDHAPGMPLIAILRDPIERAFSHWAMYAGRLPSFPSFSDLVAGGPRAHLLDRIPDGWNQLRMRRRSMVPRGLYGAQVRRGLDLFPREQWLFLDFHAFARDHVPTLTRTTAFLGLTPYDEAPRLRIIQATRTDLQAPPPTAADVEVLAGIYADDLALCERLTGLDLADWPTRQVLDDRLAPDDLAEKLARKAGLIG